MKLVHADIHLLDSADQSFQQGLRLTLALDFFKRAHQAPRVQNVSDFMEQYWRVLDSPEKIEELDFAHQRASAGDDPDALNSIAIEEIRAALSLLLRSRLELLRDEAGFGGRRIQLMRPEPVWADSVNHLFTLSIECDQRHLADTLDLLLDELSEDFMGEAKIELLEPEQPALQEEPLFTSFVLTKGSLGADKLPGQGDWNVALILKRPSEPERSIQRSMDRDALTALARKLPPAARCTPGRRMDSIHDLLAESARRVLSRLQPGSGTIQLSAEDWSSVSPTPELRLTWSIPAEASVDISDAQDALDAMAQAIQDDQAA